MKRYLVIYTDTADGINTTEQLTFNSDTYGEAIAAYDLLKSQGMPNLYFTEVIMFSNIQDLD